MRTGWSRKNAFDGCENLKKIIIKSEKLKAGNVGKNAFANGSDEVIVKTSKKKMEAYKKLLKKRGISKNDYLFQIFRKRFFWITVHFGCYKRIFSYLTCMLRVLF